MEAAMPSLFPLLRTAHVRFGLELSKGEIAKDYRISCYIYFTIPASSIKDMLPRIYCNCISIVGSLSDHSKAVTCLAYSSDGISLVSGSEDGTVRVWNTKTRHVVRVLKHGKGPVNNVIIVRHPIRLRAITSETVDIASSRKQSLAMLPPPLARYIETGDENAESRPVKVLLKPVEGSITSEFLSSQVMMSQIKELQNQGSSASVEMELERLKVDCTRSLQMLEQWQKMYQDLLKLSTNELLDECQGGDTNRTA